MKIAIIQPRASYYIAGSEKISFNHVGYLSKRGHIVDLYTSQVKESEQSFLFKEFISNKPSGVNIFEFDIRTIFPDIYKEVPDREHIRWMTESIAFNREIFNHLIQHRPDVILSYYLPDTLFKPVGIPNVVYLSGYTPQSIPAYAAFMKFCDAAIAISSTVKDSWSKELQALELQYVLGTGVEYPTRSTQIIPKKAKCDIVFAGRLIERKGILTLLEVFQQLTDFDVHLWILGDGELEGVVKERIATLNLSSKISMPGMVSNPEDYFTMSDICVFPSHTGDGLMGTVLESMAAGKPVITTFKSGSEDVITNGHNGILVEPRDMGALKTAILELINNKEKREELGLNAEVFVKEYKTWEKNSETLSGIFEDIVQKKKKVQVD